MNIYLDIDGVILVSDQNTKVPPHGAIELLEYLTNNHEVFWLTTHCHGGENHAPEYLKQYYPESTHELLDRINPTNWDAWKSDAIDFTQDFLWLDDNVFESELKVLERNNCRDKLIKINLVEDPFQLVKVKGVLESN